MLNQIVLMGRLTKDPELRMTQNQKPVASFTLAVDRDYSAGGERETDFISCIAWGRTADFVHQYFGKGQMTVVTGRLQLREWTDRDGNKRTSAEVVADRIYFGESRRGGVQDAEGFNPAGKPVNVSAETFTELADSDGELPF